MNEYTLGDVTFTNHILERFVEILPSLLVYKSPLKTKNWYPHIEKKSLFFTSTLV